MIKLPFLSKNQEPTSLAAVDLGSSTAKVVIFIPQEEKIEILGFGKAEQAETEMREGMIADLKAVAQNTKQALEEAVLSCGARPKEAIFGVSSQIIKGFTVRARLTRPHSEEAITKKELDEVLKRLESEAFKKVVGEWATETGREDLKIEKTHSEVRQVFLDGFEISNPLGFKGQNLEIALYVAFILKDHLSLLKNIASFLRLKPLKIAHSTYPLLKETPDQVLLNVGERATEVTVAINRGILGTKVVSLGGEHFTKEDVLDWWLRCVEVALDEFDLLELPPLLGLVGEGSVGEKLREKIISHPWEKNLPFPKFPQIESWEIADFKKLEDKSGRIESAAEIVPAVLTMLALK